MNHIKLFEDFEYMPQRNVFQKFKDKAIKKTKSFIGMENDNDRESLETIYRALFNEYQFIKDIRDVVAGESIIASFNNDSILVDIKEPEITYKGVSLDLHNIDEEANKLYDYLSRMKKGQIQ